MPFYGIHFTYVHVGKDSELGEQWIQNPSLFLVLFILEREEHGFTWPEAIKELALIRGASHLAQTGSNKYQEYKNLKTNKGTAVKGSPGKRVLFGQRVFIATMKKEKSNLKIRTVCLISLLCMSLSLISLRFLALTLKRQKPSFWSAGITRERTWVRTVLELKR